MAQEPRFRSLVPDWQTSDGETIARTPIFELRALTARSPSRPDETGRFVYLDSADWVNVIALTAQSEVVVIEQFRHGRREVTVEIPGGMVDPGEDPLAAGLRELLEETGYEGHDASIIGRVTPNPAILNNHCHTVLVRGVSRVREPALETHEEIGVRLVPVRQIDALIADGTIDHALVVAAFHWHALHADNEAGA